MNLKYSWHMDFKKILLIIVFILLATVGKVFSQLTDDVIIIANEIGTTSLTKKHLTAYAKGEKNFWTNNKKVIIAKNNHGNNNELDLLFSGYSFD